MSTPHLRNFVQTTVAVCAGLHGIAVAQTKQLPLPGEVFAVGPHTAFVIDAPQSARRSGPAPWVWYAPTLTGLPSKAELWMFERFLAKGIAIAGIDVGESYGSPAGRRGYDALYDRLTTQRGFSAKPVLLARSRGGLMLYSWAIENPHRVAAIAGIYPVCDLASYPGLRRAAPAYGMTPTELETQLAAHNPIDRLAPLVDAAVPIHHLHGDADRVVPLAANSGELGKRYAALGGPVEVSVFEGKGHDMWSGWFESKALTDFAITHAIAQTRPQPAARPEMHLLWPSGAPGALGDANKDKPRVQIYHAPTSNTAHPAIVICPGGGYRHLAMDHEGHQIARWLNTLGITGVILEYRHRGKGYGHPIPLGDAQRAVRLVRHMAAEWRIDPSKIGVLGFSAGGHLASSVSVHFDDGDPAATDSIDRRSCRPDFAVLCYAVLAFGQPFTHKGSQRNLLGADPAPELLLEMSSERQVDADTPPTFLWHTSADRAVPAQNSVAYYLALRRHGVPCELHVFEQGRHGVGLARGIAAEAWPELCRRWLVTRGVLSK